MAKWQIKIQFQWDRFTAEKFLKIRKGGTSLAVQWLRFGISTGGGVPVWFLLGKQDAMCLLVLPKKKKERKNAIYTEKDLFKN